MQEPPATPPGQLLRISSIKYCSGCSRCDSARALDAGFDDFIQEPLKFTEFAARLRALYRRRASATGSFEHQVGDLYLNSRTRVVTRAGRRLFLQRRPFQILEYLIERHGQVVPKSELIDRIWDYNFDPTTSMVETQISRLRAAVDKPFPEKLIHTVRGFGYQLAVEPVMQDYH